MYFKIKVSNKTLDKNGKEKNVLETYLTEAVNFADAGYKVIQIVGTEAEVEDVCMMKSFKPAVIVKVAEDQLQEDGSYKTIKYVLPAFANDSNQLNSIMKDYISQGLENMRLTTISETKWIYIE